MKPERKSIQHDSLLSPETQIHTAQIVHIEDIGLSIPHDRHAPSGSAIVAQGTEQLLSISRRDKGFLHQFGVITTPSTGMQTAVVYFRADAELHVLAMTDAEAEVLAFLSDAQRSGTLNVLWVTPTGDRRLSLLPFDDCLVRMLRDARRALTSDVLSSMYDAVEALHYALRRDILHEQGVDASVVRQSVVHYVATRATLDRAGKLSGPMLVTKH